jgi:Lrp/AsnC family transcriptional regulator, leucine-responsive regulatory protein
MPSEIDRMDQLILHILEDDSRLPIEALATRAGVSQDECKARIERLQRTGHIGSFTIVRNYPDAATMPVFGLISITPDPRRNGQDLLRSMESIPEIVTAEILNTDESVLVRLQVPDQARLEAIAEHFRRQFSVLSLEVSMTMPLLTHVPPRRPVTQ